MVKADKELMDKIIFEIGDMIRVRNKSKFPIPFLFGLGFGKIPLTPREIIDTVEFKMEFEKPFPATAKFILDNFKEVANG